MTPSASGAARACFAEILDYPGPGLCARVEAGIAQLAPAHPDAADRLRQFLGAIRGLATGELQEIYTGTFDFRPDCCLHAGWHLFGDDPRRAAFLVGLAERYRAREFARGKEIPDHLPLMLRFVSTPDVETEEIVLDALLPALTSIGRELEKGDNPYRHAVASAIELLQGSVPAPERGERAPSDHAAGERALTREGS